MDNDEGRKMVKEVVDNFWITLGPEHPHSKMTERPAAYFFDEYCTSNKFSVLYQSELWSQSVNRYRTLPMITH